MKSQETGNQRDQASFIRHPRRTSVNVHHKGPAACSEEPHAPNGTAGAGIQSALPSYVFFHVKILPKFSLLYPPPMLPYLFP